MDNLVYLYDFRGGAPYSFRRGVGVAAASRREESPCLNIGADGASDPRAPQHFLNNNNPGFV